MLQLPFKLMMTLLFFCISAPLWAGNHEGNQQHDRQHSNVTGDKDQSSLIHEEQAVRAVIEAMNQAVSGQQPDKLLSTFAEGAVRVDLFKAHSYGQSDPDSPVRSTDLAQRWRTVLALLENSTADYQRRVSHMTIHIDGDMAIAWARINTGSVSVSDKEALRKNSFTEMILLKKVDRQWKIASLSNNRRD